ALILAAYTNASIAAPVAAPALEPRPAPGAEPRPAPADDAMGPRLFLPTLQAVGSDRASVYLLDTDNTAPHGNLAQRGAGWWSAFDDPLAPTSDGFKMRVLRLGGSTNHYSAAQLAAAAAAAPGSAWEFGNEPNVPGQDNVNPAIYATRYKTYYDAIKQADPT